LIKLSVIIPVYNAENYLTECIESVLNQNYPGELEVILVDDGSTDQSPYICDYYATMDNRIKVIHKENGGTSSARNAGIDAANGDYLVFLDSDDFWIANTVHDFLKIADEAGADIIIGNAVKYLDAERRFDQYPNNLTYDPMLKSANEKLLYILKPGNRFQWHIWKCFFKADLIKNNRLYFKKGLLFEDVEWMPRVFSHAEKIEICDKIFVCYRVQRTNSNTTDMSKSVKRHRDMLKVIYYLSVFFNEIPMDQRLKHYFFINFSESYVHVFMRQALVKDKYSKYLLKRLSYYIFFYQGKHARTLKLIFILFGYSNTCKIVRVIGKTVLLTRKLKGGKKCRHRFRKLKRQLASR